VSPLSNFIKISQFVVGILRFFEFSRWRPSAILDFENVKILLANGVKKKEIHQHAKFHENWPIRCGLRFFYISFNMATIRHL